MSPSSNLTSRYLPLRSVLTILRPSTRAMKSFLFVWRRIERTPLTSTDFTRLPTTSLSRSRRIVSTSGSSGIVALVWPAAGRVGVGVGVGGRQQAPRRPGGGLLGLLLR